MWYPLFHYKILNHQHFDSSEVCSLHTLALKKFTFVVFAFETTKIHTFLFFIIKVCNFHFFISKVGHVHFFHTKIVQSQLFQTTKICSSHILTLQAPQKFVVSTPSENKSLCWYLEMSLILMRYMGCSSMFHRSWV